MGGVSRSYSGNALYGLHRFGVSDKTVSGDDAQVVTGLLANYIERMGASQTILQAAASASFENDIFPVPVALGKQMRIIYDASGQTSFQIEDVEGRAVAGFEFTMREKHFGGVIRCIQDAKMLIIFDRDDVVPVALRKIKDAPTEFVDGTGKKLRALASYIPSDKVSTVIFKIPAITASSFSGQGLTLDNIRNLESERRCDPKAPKDDAMADKFDWQDSVNEFSFQIRASNGANTLPVVLRECTKR